MAFPPFQFSIVTIKKKYHPSGNLKFNNLGISQSLTHYRPAMPFGKRKFILDDLFSSVLS